MIVLFCVWKNQKDEEKKQLKRNVSAEHKQTRENDSKQLMGKFAFECPNGDCMISKCNETEIDSQNRTLCITNQMQKGKKNWGKPVSQIARYRRFCFLTRTISNHQFTIANHKNRLDYFSVAVLFLAFTKLVIISPEPYGKGFETETKKNSAHIRMEWPGAHISWRI